MLLFVIYPSQLGSEFITTVKCWSRFCNSCHILLLGCLLLTTRSSDSVELFLRVGNSVSTSPFLQFTMQTNRETAFVSGVSDVVDLDVDGGGGGGYEWSLEWSWYYLNLKCWDTNGLDCRNSWGSIQVWKNVPSSLRVPLSTNGD